MAEKINIEGQEISIKIVNENDYISLTDIARRRYAQEPKDVVRSWLNNNSTLLYLEAWEKMYNPDFKGGEMTPFKIQASEGRIRLRVQDYIKRTSAIGIISKSGRYGGTYAHKDIAFEFASWLEPVFKLFLITEFQRLKSEEYKQKELEWDTSRFLSKINYSLQTTAIEENLIPKLEGREKGLAYATEADLINLALFGQTAKQWRMDNPEIKGNIRDHASITQLIVLSNLETHNSYLIKAGASKEARFARLCEIAESQLEIFSKDKRLNDDKKFLE
ncbi:MAG: KilA-N domain-containing protein [Bacteroidota bacterium]